MRIYEAQRLCLLNYGPFYYVGLVFGVLPFKYDRRLLYTDKRSTGPTFSASFAGRFFCYLFLGLNLFTGVFVLKNSIKAALTYDSCFDKICDINLCRNVCAHFTSLWMNFIANLISSLMIIFIRRNRTLRCLNSTNTILRKRIHDFEFTPAAWSPVLFLGVHCSSFYLHWRNSEFSVEFLTSYVPFYLTQCLPVVTENMISVLLLITRDCYQDVNNRLAVLIDARFFLLEHEIGMKESLAYLRRYYAEITDLADEIANCFGFDFFVAGICSTIRFIYFLFLTLQYMAEQQVINATGGLVLPSYQSIVFFVAVVGKFYYLCYRCDKVVAETKRVTPNLCTLQNKLRGALDNENQQQVEEFLNYVKCHEVSFSACSFFTLNLHLIRSVFGITITYFIVLMQFQASHQK